LNFSVSTLTLCEGENNPMPRKTTYAGQEMSTPGGRIEFLLRDRWNDNQRRMAAEIGVAQTAISKAVRGEQPPGLKFLLAIAKVPGLNKEWVLEGLGEPYSRLAPTRASEGKTLPVSWVILPGPVEEYGGLLTELRLDFEGLVRPSLYAIELQPGEPVTRSASLNLRPGDYLVMESDRDVWGLNPQVLLGKLCAIRLAAENGPTYLFARADLSRGPEQSLELRLIGVEFVVREPKGEEGRRESMAGSGMRRRRVVPMTGGVPSLKSVESSRPMTGDVPSLKSVESSRPNISDVVAYCTLMIRTKLFQY
jgi:transcriptional regulator with XRE-family HTH domain